MMKSKGEALIKVENLIKNFIIGQQEVKVLKGISLTINKGEFSIIFGPSGCGKSTLLHSILGMEKPTEGRVIVDGESLYDRTEDEIVKFRKGRIGVVFQQPIWIKSLSVLENVCVPNRLKGMEREESEVIGIKALERVHLQDWANYHPSELSSGQQQRVSLARALTINPMVLVADEPTGNLDTQSGDELMDLLSKLNQDEGKTILMVTHDLEYLRYATKLFHIIDGELSEEVDQEGARKLAGVLRSKKGDRKKVSLRDENYLKINHYGKEK